MAVCSSVRQAKQHEHVVLKIFESVSCAATTGSSPDWLYRHRHLLFVESVRIMSGRKVPSVGGGGGGAEPDLKRRRTLDAGGPVEDDETARQKLRDARVYERGVRGPRGYYVGFDPDNVSDVKCLNCIRGRNLITGPTIKPIGYFASKGDLRMMRWLYVNGADTRDVDVTFCFPMRWAALAGQMGACKWLLAHGAAEDVKRRVPTHGSTLSVIFGRPTHRDLSRWLVLKGALCKDDGSRDLNVEIMQQDLDSTLRIESNECAVERDALLKWATDLHRARTSFLLFLSGACITRRSSSPVKALSGKSGVLELIFDYTGVVRGREAKILRQLTELLPDLFE